jgi:hypothetical protein
MVRSRIVLAVVGLIIAVLSMGIPVLQAGTIWREVDVFIFIAVMLALACGPFIVYVVFVRTRFWTLMVGMVLVAATALTNAMVLTDEHSTAPLGFLTSIMVNYVIAVVGMALDSTQRQRE